MVVMNWVEWYDFIPKLWISWKVMWLGGNCIKCMWYRLCWLFIYWAGGSPLSKIFLFRFVNSSASVGCMRSLAFSSSVKLGQFCEVSSWCIFVCSYVIYMEVCLIRHKKMFVILVKWCLSIIICLYVNNLVSWFLTICILTYLHVVYSLRRLYATWLMSVG